MTRYFRNKQTAPFISHILVFDEKQTVLVYDHTTILYHSALCEVS